jgi:acetyl esterase/lipase
MKTNFRLLVVFAIASRVLSQTAPRPDARVDIVATLDVPYAGVAGVAPIFLSLDVHAPKDAKAAPVIIYVHGGYWKAGDKSAKGHLPGFFCRHGYVFVSVNYRLAPAARDPAPVQDVARAVAWVHDHIAAYGGDPAQLYLTGHSAGAHLVALVGTDPKRLAEFGKPLSILRAVIPLDSAAMDIRDVAANDRRADSPYRDAFGDDPAAWADASPIVHVGKGKGFPPFLMVVAYGPAIASKKRGLDAFADALRCAGTRAEVVDASSFREHQSLMTEFGTPDDPVAKAVLEFIEGVRKGTLAPGLGGERVLQTEGVAAAESARQLEAYRTRILMRQFDKGGDGRITREEMSANPFLFDRIDADRDGAVSPDELNRYFQREQPVQKAADAPPATQSQAAAAWVPDDQRLGTAEVSYLDPEFLQDGTLVVFADQHRTVWVGEIDPRTGGFAKSPSGCDYRIDSGLSPWSRYSNGPEWGLDAAGPALFYLKDNAQGTGQLWRAEPPWGKPRLTQLTHDTDVHNWLCEPSVNAAAATTRIVIYRGGGPKGSNVSAWIDEERPTEPHGFASRAYLARFSYGTSLLAWGPRRRAEDPETTQVSLLDTETGASRLITDDDGAKHDPWLWHAPEFDGELLLCVNVDQRALAVYRDQAHDGKTPWTRTATLTLPADAPHHQLKSCEPVNGGRGAFGRSWFTAQAGDDKDPDTSIWLLGFGPGGNHTTRRLDNGAVTGKPARRLDPESLVGENELFVYYTLVGDGPSQLHRCRASVRAANGP